MANGSASCGTPCGDPGYTALDVMRDFYDYAAIPVAPACVTALPCWAKTFGTSVSAAGSLANALLNWDIGYYYKPGAPLGPYPGGCFPPHF